MPRRSAPRNDMQKHAAACGCNCVVPWQIRDALRMRPKCCYFAMPHRRRSGLSRRSAPRNDSGGDVTAPQCPAPADTWHVFAHLARQTFLHPQTRYRLQHVIASQCAHWRGNPRLRRETLQIGNPQGKSVALFRIRLRYCSPPCPTARVTDCHVAPLLAMTCRNMQLPAVATAWCHGKSVALFRIRLRYCSPHALPQELRIATSLRSSQ